jgi:serine/threonine-protein kinase RsbW
MSDATSGTKEFVLPSKLRVLDRVDRLTIKYSKLAGFSEDAACMVSMAAIEAVTNGVVHGNQQSPDKKVRLVFEWSPGRIKIVVHDEGEGFDLKCVLDPTDPERCMASCGRGIYIMREVMDSVEFEMPNGTGTTVTMTKDV